ncbi:hypothetical protein [Micromonospora sp. NBC_01813]|uniref:hypothetical protein n=1 Tax=Micromonospora sp. NBC_01813 TaxID=2975988 RepID=UPI002DD952F1|nr:hypothetical protein [Micromonospora sp. NBC_01813]WSA09012.1 hypothetical protein OG958_33470 [Micromonospora sp. NBC_01813]
MADEPQSFAAELSTLLNSRPTWTASAEERAAWYDRKADLFNRTAADTSSPGVAGEASDLAEIAREQANRIRRGWSA